MGRGCSKVLEGDKLHHDRLGLIQLLPNQQDQSPRIKLKKQIQNVQKYGDWERQMKLLLQQDFRQVFYLPQSYGFVQQGMCGTSGSIEMEFEYYKFTLKNQIANRQLNEMPFEETQLWYLLYNILEASFLLEPLGRRIGDVHPRNIVINQNGRVKIIPVCLFPGTLNNYQRMVQQKVSDAFLAPEEIDDALIQRGIYPNIDSCKAEVFSIGLTMLLAASLQDGYDLYDHNALKFNTSKKKEYFNEIAVSYSTYFCSILHQMLEEDPEKRKNSSDIFRQLNKFEDEILSLRRFNLIQNKIKEVEREALKKNSMGSQEASIADFISQHDEKGSFSSPNNSLLIQNFKSF